MKRIILFVLVIFIFTSSGFANSSPVASNVTVSQRTDGSKLVDIYYNLSDADGDECALFPPGLD